MKRETLTDPHFIRRHGFWFRPEAHGYTQQMAEAGIFDGERARRYLDVEGLTIHPIASVRQDLADQIVKMRTSLRRLESLLAHIEGPAGRQALADREAQDHG